jgi:enoyl-CoA hydratase
VSRRPIASRVEARDLDYGGTRMLDLDLTDGVARITLNNPPANALSREWADAFFAILDQLESRDDWRVLLVRSNQKIFSAGGDIKQYAGRLEREDAGELLAEEAAYYQKLFARISKLPQVSIAEIGGVAAGGGMELALACDLRIADENVKLGLPEVSVGLLPAGGGTQRMTALCGRGAALRLIGLAELVTGREALALGLVEWAVPADELQARALDIARRFAQQAPEALRAAKACIAVAADRSQDGFAFELTHPPLLMKSAATQQRIKDFLARRR